MNEGPFAQMLCPSPQVGHYVSPSPRTLCLLVHPQMLRSHYRPVNRCPGKFTSYNNLLKYTNLEINLEEILNILPCNSYRGQKFYYSGMGITQLLLGALNLL